jgi:dihydroorotate dehydrogenase (NAD+) catalytic subunit
MVQRLENIENIAAVELGFAPQLADDILLLALEMSLGELPLIVSLPWEQVLTLGPRLVQAGAAALSLAAPRGALPSNTDLLNNDHWSLTTGRLYGPSIFPQALGIVRDAARLGLPMIGGGGVYSHENVQAMLAAGALAVQIDSVLWRGDWADK